MMPMDQNNSHTWNPGDEVVGVYDFNGRSRDDLAFQKGDLLVIVKSTTDPNWFRVRNGNGEEGMVPANYVKLRKVVTLHAMPWYHGSISREETEKLLVNQEDGVYLVRDSIHYVGDRTLSISFSGHIDHYRLLSGGDGKVMVDGGDCSFSSLLDLVEVVTKLLPLMFRAWKVIWFHGKISRKQAEDLLTPREDGLFLVRESSNFPGDYTLCVCHQGKVEHYRIVYQNNNLTVDEECFFKNLDELVQHYSQDADGLCTKLIRPVNKQGDSFGTVSIQDFKSGGWVISKSDLHLGELIGRGDFGDVYKGTYKSQAVAAKQLKDRERGSQSFLQEASVMTSLRHPNLVKLIGVVLGDVIVLVTEFMGKGNLVEYLRSRGRNVITKKDQINFATDTCAAMQYLESKGLVHRDLAARNVLVHDDGTAKVSDFGLAKFGDFSLSSQRFPIKWTAPEALRNNDFTNKSDMWSFGILLWEIYSFGRVPYPRIPLADVVMHVEKGYRMEAPDSCPPEIYKIMKQSWELRPGDRPTFQQVLLSLNNLRSVTV